MADNQIQVTISADASGLTETLQDAATSAQVSFQSIGQAAQTVNVQINELAPNAQKNLKTATSATDNWTKSFANLDHAFSSSITGMVLGTETWQKAVKRLSQTALTDLVNLAQKELATWIAKETGMTAATTAGNTTRAASNTASQSGFFTLIAQALAKWLGLETGKTAATQAGDTARSAADTAAAAASAATAVARGLGMIQISAAEAAAAAFADSAELGPPGLVAAPGAAAAAYTMAMSYATGLGASLFSAAGGAWNVPSDMLAMVHKQESILPAGVAQPMREFFSGGGAAGVGGGGDSYAITIQAIDTQSGAQFLLSNAGVIAQGLAREVRNGNAALRSAMK